MKIKVVKVLTVIMALLLCCGKMEGQIVKSDTVKLQVDAEPAHDSFHRDYDSQPVYMDKEMIKKTLGIEADELAAAYANGKIRIDALQGQEALPVSEIFGLPGHWYDEHCQVTTASVERMVFSTFDLKLCLMNIGQKPDFTEPGEEYSFVQAITMTKPGNDGCFHRLVYDVTLKIQESVPYVSVPIDDGTFCIENYRVNSFMKAAQYTDNSSASLVEHYNTGPLLYRDRPAPVPESWKVQNGENIYSFYPNQTYTYKVVEDGKEISIGTFTTSGQVRMIYTEALGNIRDIGGWDAEDGKKVCYGLLYRGCEMNGSFFKITNADIKNLRNIGIKAVLDLRNPGEANNITKSPLGADIDYKLIPNKKYYLAGVRDSAFYYGYDLKYILQELKQNKPVYFHCVHGGDRVGTLAFLLEGLLGMNYSDICKEFELTTFSYFDTTRTKKSLDELFDYINTFSGKTLQDKFYTYWTTEAGITDAEVQEFKKYMLTSDITGIQDVRVFDIPSDKTYKSFGIFDLSGRAQPAPTAEHSRKIYIMNGRKVIR